MEPAGVVDGWFAANPELPVERTAVGGWLTVLRGERKRTVPVHLLLGQHTLALESFFVRAPEENLADTYAYLLRRHLRSYVLRFALTADADVLLVGQLPRHAVTPEELDRVLGQLLAVADDAFDTVLRTGFASYIAREQQWRDRVGLARNPIS